VKVVFIQYGVNIEHASMMVQSCKKLGYEVIQLSCHAAPEVKGVDEIHRDAFKPGEGRMLYRARRLTELKAPYVLLDTDMIVARDISDGFGEDVALTWRPKHLIITKGEIGPIRMPYNGGVIFVSDHHFMIDCYEEMLKLPPNRQDWYGDQIALRDVAESGKYKVKELRDEVWNFCPDSFGHDIPGVRIYHFKGQRKAIMPSRWRVMNGERP
jgi:hypothetical protein